jgi:tRNA uridine 5-carbamoylmethylation protein Kti12
VQVIEYDQITKSLIHEKSGNIEKKKRFKAWLDDVEAWKETRSHALHMLETHLFEMKRRSIHEEHVPKSIVIMDDNFYLRSMRREIYKTCQDFISNSQDVMGKIGLTFVHVDTNLQQCIINNEMRKNTEDYIPQETILKMSRSMEPPNVQKAPFERLSICTSNYLTEPMTQPPTLFYQALDKLIDKSIQFHIVKRNEVKNEEELEEERKITRLSIIHRLDLILRSLVGKTCKCDKTLARTANEVRKSIILDLPKNEDIVQDMERLEEWIEAKYHDELKKRVNSIDSNI